MRRGESEQGGERVGLVGRYEEEGMRGREGRRVKRVVGDGALRRRGCNNQTRTLPTGTELRCTSAMLCTAQCAVHTV